MLSLQSDSSNSVNNKKVLLLTRQDGNNLIRLIENIRQTGCKIVLLCTALGYNHSLNEKSYDDLGARMRTIYTNIIDPPPILTITCMSQLVPLIETLDPDLVISCYFPYQLTKSFLAHRSVKINYHPSPLPLYRGANCFARAILNQITPWAITWHYVTEDYDMGNILIQEFFELQTPYGFLDFVKRSCDIMFGTIGKVIEMSLSGHPGTPQRLTTIDEQQYVCPKPFTIAERTITSGWTCHKVWCMVEAFKYSIPALLVVDERLYQVIEARRLETSLSCTLAMGEVKRIFDRYVQQCIDGQMEYTLRIV